MIQDFIYDSTVFDNRNDLHLTPTFWAKQGIRFINEFDQRRPGGFALLDPFTFGIIFRDVCLRRVIWKLSHS